MSKDDRSHDRCRGVVIHKGRAVSDVSTTNCLSNSQTRPTDYGLNRCEINCIREWKVIFDSGLTPYRGQTGHQ